MSLTHSQTQTHTTHTANSRKPGVPGLKTLSSYINTFLRLVDKNNDNICAKARHVYHHVLANLQCIDMFTTWDIVYLSQFISYGLNLTMDK